VTWRDALALAARGVLRRPGRAVLTVAAVALASALLTTLLAIAATGRSRVLDQLSGGGPLAGIKVFAAAPSESQLDSDDPRPGPARDLDDDARRRIAALPGVKSVAPVVAVPVLVVPPDPGDPFEESLVGVDLGDPGRLPVSVLAGRLPAPGSRTEVAVTEGYLKRLGLARERAATVVGTELVSGAPRAFTGGSPIRIRGRWSRALIVGVVDQEAASGQLLVPLAVGRQAREWTVSGGDDSGRLDVPSSPYSALLVVARSLKEVTAVRARITGVGYATTAPENLIASVLRYVHVVEIVLGAIGLVALVSAALGIANALLAAVRERRREIGVLKAIGARDLDVARAFLLEAGFLGFLGGLLGALAGSGVARAVGVVVNRYLTAQHLAGVSVDLPVGLLVGAVGGAGLLAMAAGALPAVRAARLPAREAMGEL
jgi:putative ABC transport system permease protein